MEDNILVKLTNGNKFGEGYVEVAFPGYGFGGVCDDGFQLEEANVICRSAGFKRGATRAWSRSHFGHGNNETAIIVDNLDCNGNEQNFMECQYNNWTVHNCGSDEWAGVTCNLGYENIDLNQVVKLIDRGVTSLGKKHINSNYPHTYILVLRS